MRCGSFGCRIIRLARLRISGCSPRDCAYASKRRLSGREMKAYWTAGSWLARSVRKSHHVRGMSIRAWHSPLLSGNALAHQSA